MPDSSPARLTPAAGREFGLTVGGAFGVIAGIAWMRDHPTLASVLGMLAASLLIMGLLAPTRLGPVSRGWMRMAHAMSRVTTPVFMGVVFFGVMTPVGLIMRALGRNPVKHRLIGGSYWAPRDDARGDMTNQF